MSLGLSAAAMNTCQLYSQLEWKVLVPVLTRPAMMAEVLRIRVEGLLMGLERMERVFAWLALGFMVWAFRSGSPHWPAWVALLPAVCALIMALHISV
ncbi:hypothetical protein HMI49_16180 [Corallococcus exercitus]|uniref:Uncharacterized protein n=1 Tax=Corallococcus exercitus TaxID=2316736 RepID=A0A7Y4KJE2_9BACT|nr:hypothetical protein [Corallococcus exercitus]NOK34737.1 hypothetical protein [Corallococcus exercitus]